MKSLKLFVFVFFAAIFVFSSTNNFSQTKKDLSAKKTPAKTTISKTNVPTQSVAKISSANTVVEKPVEKYASSAMEQAILDEINIARKEPQRYIQYLEDYKKLFKGNTAYLPNNVWMETKEGVVPIDEAIVFLKTLPQLNPYGFSNGLNKAANMQLRDLVENSSLGHFGKDGSDLQKRLAKFGTVNGKYAENLAFYSETARDVVLMMIIDDNVKSRSHRKNIFSPTFKMIGISFGKGRSGEGLCVVNFADDFSESTLKPGVREF